jgi:DNA-binding CsgD family transcriptional regulator
MTGTDLVGRDDDLSLLHDLVDHATERGGALVVRGEAGIGKSALLAAAGRRARARDMLVLTTSGVQAEAHLPFAGLQLLLRPIWEGLDGLPAPQRAAVLAAFGMTDVAAPDPYLIALATLNLLAETAAQAPLLLIVEDAQWVDRSTCSALMFVARRLEVEPIVMLFAVRDGFDSPLDHSDLPVLQLTRLNAAAARALLDAHAPDLAAPVRARLLDDALGNPLALVELPAALASEHLGGDVPLPTWLPLTTRLEQAFTARIADLPAATRTLLLVAALDDSSAIAEVLTAAGSLLTDGPLTVEALHPAIEARLVAVDDLELRFHHPLVRSAIRQATSSPHRQAAHAALADVAADQPDRRAWHLAATCIGPNEEVAAELAAAATRARHRGAIAVASLAFERAARLSVSPSGRGTRLLRAAELAYELGRRDELTRLVHDAERLDLEPLDRSRMTILSERFDDGIPADPARVLAQAELADQTRIAGDPELSLLILYAIAVKCWWADPGAVAREAVIACAARHTVAADDPRLLNILALTDPIGRGADVSDRLAEIAAGPLPSARTTIQLSGAACALGHYELASQFLTVAVDGMRAEGRLGPPAQALVMRALSSVYLTTLGLVRPDAEEGGRLARETGQPQWTAYARFVEAMLAGLRGEEDAAEALAAEAERIVLPTRTNAVLAAVQLARGLTALSGGRYPDAFEQLRRIFDPTDRAYHPMSRGWAIGDLVEAAVHSGQRDAATALVTEMEPIAAQHSSPRIQISMRYARALLADDESAEPLFHAALNAGAVVWPLDQARLQLAYGAWLRRQRRITESRTPLRAARDAFDALGVLPWGERARLELRAAGESSRRRAPNVLDLLTPQELQIAQLAAEGLSNREIGQRLYLSHRTIGSHLYHIFPKLGITQRAELRAALQLGGSVPA